MGRRGRKPGCLLIKVKQFQPPTSLHAGFLTLTMQREAHLGTKGGASSSMVWGDPMPVTECTQDLEVKGTIGGGLLSVGLTWLEDH
jgi:hypothetical protein